MMTSFKYQLTVGLLLALCSSALSQSNISVATKKGPIVGLSLPANASTTNVAYDAFIGIPYGRVPARFQLAVSPDSWSEPLVTQVDGPVCPQPGVSFSEQCLTINVFTPKDAYKNTNSNLPVMVFIHGSAFTYGSSSSSKLGPDFIVQQGVLLVTMNYRLGAAGFLTLSSKVAPGNLGLHDTLLALQWVRDEIAVFGGDPRQVTLFGQSAGGVMTTFHYLSHISTDLFRGAIAQSGSAMADWGLVTAEEGSRRGRQLAQRLGCNVALSDEKILDCLQKADINHVVGNQSLITLSTRDKVNGNQLIFVPVMDSQQTADKPFFNDSLINLLKAAPARGKPLLTGFTTDEGIMMFSGEPYKLAEANLAAFLPKQAHTTEQENSVRKKYFPSAVDQNKVQNLVTLFTDFMFAYPSVQLSRYLSNITYGYLFAYDGSWTTTPSYFSRYRQRGVCHGDDVLYLFYSQGSSQSVDSCTTNADNLKVKDNMVRWWTNFAKTGVPDDTWKNISAAGYLVIDSTPYFMNTTEFESRYYDFWANLYQPSASSASSTTFAAVMLITAICKVLQ